MPYKAKDRSPSKNSKKQQRYKIINWSAYNKSLKRRGSLSLYFPKGDIHSQFINDTPYVPGVSGRQPTYSPAYIQLCYTLYWLIGFAIRQTTGYIEDFWKLNKLDIATPSFGHLSDLFSSIPLKVQQYCTRLAKRINNGDAVSLILDSTGLRFDKACDWYERKYGKKKKNRPWRKLHIAIDTDMNIYSSKITENDVDDRDMMPGLISNSSEALVDKVIADGAYYSIEIAQTLYDHGIMPVIPPPSHAVTHAKDKTQWHDKIVNYIKEKGSVYAFHKKYGYGERSLVEAQMSRIKRCIGAKLKTQKLESQENEAVVIANIINKWNSFGQCIAVRTG